MWLWIRSIKHTNVALEMSFIHSFPEHCVAAVTMLEAALQSKWNNHDIIIIYYVRLWIAMIYLLPGASLECLQIDKWTSPIVPELMFTAGMTLIRREAATDREKRRRPKWRVCFELCSPAPVITIV